MASGNTPSANPQLPDQGKEALWIENLKNAATRERAFTEVMKAYQQPLYWHIRRFVFDHDEADDLLQVTFIKAWQHLDSFRGDAKLKTWLYRIATNEALSLLRKNKNRQMVELSEVENSFSMSETWSGHADGDEIAQKLMAAVNTLPDKQKVVFNMKYFDDLKYEEIAEILGGSVGSLKASFHHAVKKIEDYLQQD